MLTDEELQRLVPRWYKAVLDWNDAIRRKAPEDERRRLQQLCRQESMALTDAELEHLSGGDEEKFRAMKEYCQAVQSGVSEAQQQRLLEKVLGERR